MTRTCCAVWTAVVMGLGCASAADYTTDHVMGNWEGTFTSKDGKTGDVAAKIVARGNGDYDGHFIVTTSEDKVAHLPFRGKTQDDTVAISGKADLGSERGGAVSFTGKISDGQFTGSYEGQGDHSGTFTLQHVKRTPPTLGAKPPEGAVVLFDGKNLDQWQQPNGQPAAWKLKDGAMQVHGGSIVSKPKFTDMKLHLEFRTPFMPEASGQARGNSGVYIQGRYEVQVLDSFGEEPRDNEAGGIYKVSVPSVNASLPPGEWQTYDITFHQPTYEGKKLVKPGHITVVYNGETIHDHVEISEPTAGGLGTPPGTPGGLMLQDHHNPVEYRNIWVLPLKD